VQIAFSRNIDVSEETKPKNATLQILEDGI